MSNTRSLLVRVRSRLAVAAALESAQRGVAWGAGTALVALAADRLGWIAPGPGLCALAGLMVAIAFAGVGLLANRRDDASAAAAADERLGLAERVSTALWLERSHPAEAASLASLVAADAESAAARVSSSALAAAFRPRLMRRPLAAAGVLLALFAGTTLFVGGPAAAVAETEAERVARLADANRLAEVTVKVRAELKRVQEDAAKKKMDEVAALSGEMHRRAEPLTRAPSPPRAEALKQLNSLADLAAEQARRAAGMKDKGTLEANRTDKALEELLSEWNKSEFGTLKSDLDELERELKAAKDSGERPSAEDVRDMANRLDALRRAMDAADAAGAGDVSQRLASAARRELLSKIAERLREIAARLDRGDDADDLMADDGEDPGDALSDLSEEELKELLKRLEELSAMKDLEDMLRKASSEMRGGPKLRTDGSGGT
jgi:hypothetical protein